MTWHDARREAELRLRPLLEKAEREGLDPRNTRIALASYQDEDSLNLLNPENRWPLAFHRQVTRASMRILRTAKFQVDLIPITLANYQNWLGDRENTAATRAQFVAEKTK